jgi:hypothetical protein
MNDLRTLSGTIEALRNEQTSLISGSSKLLAYGITSHVDDVVERLEVIKVEARQIAECLERLGATRAADDARQGWAIIVKPRNDTAPSVHDGRSQ